MQPGCAARQRLEWAGPLSIYVDAVYRINVKVLVTSGLDAALYATGTDHGWQSSPGRVCSTTAYYRTRSRCVQ